MLASAANCQVHSHTHQLPDHTGNILSALKFDENQDNRNGLWLIHLATTSIDGPFKGHILDSEALKHSLCRAL